MKADLYAKALYQYGFLTLLHLLKELEEVEDYAECAIIVSVIQEHNKKYGHDIPTFFGPVADQYFQDTVRNLQMSGDNILQNIPTYVLEVKEMLKNANVSDRST